MPAQAGIHDFTYRLSGLEVVDARLRGHDGWGDHAGRIRSRNRREATTSGRSAR